MVNWVYVLKCEDDYTYIGQTSRLYARFFEHVTGRGGYNTHIHKPNKLLGLYRVNSNASFIKYRKMVELGEYNPFVINDWNDTGDYLMVEDFITERFMHDADPEWWKIRGGKHTRKLTYKEIIEGNPTKRLAKKDVVDRPLCKCGLPSEVKLAKDKQKIYFVCALSNIWESFFGVLDVDNKCDFYEVYKDDTRVKKRYEKIVIRQNESWIENLPETLYKIAREPCISCGKTGYLPIFNKGRRQLCQTCLFEKYDELKTKYEIPCSIPKESDDQWSP